ncbi:MAG: hypothetical protein SNG27_05750 [Rikenellaceae bacterium]
MVNSLLKLYAWAIDNKRSNTGAVKHYYGFIRLIAVELGQLFIPIALRLTRDKHRLETREADPNNPRLIVSLTSFPARINVVWMVVELMIRQTAKPDLIVLYLSKAQFASIDVLPKSLRRIIGRGLEVRLVDKDFRSHTKYHYAMREYPNDIIVTVDDDIFYPNYVTQLLMGGYATYPKCVIANRVQTLTFDKQNNLMPYGKWGGLRKNNDYNQLQTGVSGVLYPPPHGVEGSVMYKDLLDSELATRLTPAGDDLWLFAMTRLAGTRVIKTPQRIRAYGIRIMNNVRLCKLNCNRNFNDEQIKKLRNYYIEKLGVDPFENKKG